jgi:cellobiose-specific phosphotransferase system component IIA
LLNGASHTLQIAHPIRFKLLNGASHTLQIAHPIRFKLLNGASHTLQIAHPIRFKLLNGASHTLQFTEWRIPYASTQLCQFVTQDVTSLHSLSAKVRSSVDGQRAKILGDAYSEGHGAKFR